jgi:hypothetical protein
MTVTCIKFDLLESIEHFLKFPKLFRIVHIFLLHHAQFSLSFWFSSHFQTTQHTYSMQVGSNRVWDYAGDNYVHRLLQNKADGKLVQLDEAGRIVRFKKFIAYFLKRKINFPLAFLF